MDFTTSIWSLLMAALPSGAGRTASRLALGTALAAGVLSPESLIAQTRIKPKGAGKDAGRVSVVNSPTVKLSFFNENWADVLKKVAEQSGSTLVMDEIPSGRVNRLDSKHYSRGEAVRVLNKDLEPLGYRLMEKGDNLVLFSLRDLRTDYRRTSLNGTADGTSHGVSRPGGPPIVPQRSRAAAKNVEQPGSAEDEEAGVVRPASATSTTPRSRIQHADYSGDSDEVDAANDARPAPRRTLPRTTDTLRPTLKSELQTSNVTPESKRVDMRPVELRVALQTRKAVEVARTIFEGSKSHADLIDDGPDGLPAFTVRSPAEATGGTDPKSAAQKYTVGIDSENNELIVSAPSARARQIERLIQLLDSRPVVRGEAERLVPVAGENPKLAAHLQATINQLAQANEDEEQAQPQAQPKTQNPPVNPPQRRPAEALLQGDAAAGNAGRNANPQVLSPPVNLTLQGPVTVRDVPGVGLVVTGNRNDVDAVLDVIRVLELAGNTATPDIHLLGLRHVNSEALAELLTSVYDALSEVRAPLIGEQRKSIRVVPVGKPNSVIIIAPSREMDAVLDLAEALDQPVDPEAEVEVFRLKFAVASQIVTSIDTFYTDRKPMGTRVKTFADVRTNAIVVYARPNDLKEVARLIKKLDVGTSASVARMRIFTLENATATDLATLINQALQSVLRPPQVPTGVGGQFGGGQGGGTGQTPTGLTDVKSTILEFLSSDGDREKLIRSGILSDIRVTADPGRNTLIVSAPEASMPLIEALIQAFDQPTPLVAQIKVFTLSNSSALTTIDLLQQLFTGQAQRQGQQGGGQFGGGQFGANNQQQGGLQLAGAEGSGAGLIPLRFSVDGRTNSIIAIGPQGALEIVEAILLKLDASDVRERKKTVIKLRNTFANDIAVAVNQFLTAQRDLAQLDPNLVSTVELLEREVIVVPELVSNSLIISATPRYYQEAVELIEKLDRRPQEVTIQALLVEVTLTNNDEYGVELGVQDSILFKRSIANVPGFLFNNQQLGNNTGVGGSGRVGGQSLSNFSLNRTNPDLGFGGLVLSASSESVSVLIRALSSKRTVHVLSRPQIRTLDNQIAQILVGQQVPVATGVATTGLTAASPQVQLKDVGIVLNVIPRISPDGTIVMEVAATSSSVSATRVPIFTDINTGNTVDSPIINTTSAQATISVPNGQTVVLGGMITKSDDAFERKVPWLGDIPYVGNLFRYEGVNVRRTELLVFLTPRVVRHEADSELIKRVEAERLHFVERDAEEMHGPLYSAPPPEWYINRPQPGQGYPTAPGLFDENNVPTTVMPGLPDGSMAPIPGYQGNTTQETLPPPRTNGDPLGVPDPPPNRLPQRPPQPNPPNGTPNDLPPPGANSTRTWSPMRR
jgi:type II secretion system protein D